MLPAIPWMRMFLYWPARMAAMLFAFEMVLEIGSAMLDCPVQYLAERVDVVPEYVTLWAGVRVVSECCVFA